MPVVRIGVAAAVGGVGSILMSYRAVKSPGLAVLSGVLGATATSLAADDVSLSDLYRGQRVDI